MPDAAAARRATLCLDFANTLLWHASAEPRETLHGYAELLRWAAKHGALAAGEAEALARRAARPGAAAREAAAVLVRAGALREAFYRIVVARLTGRRPDGADVDRLNDELQHALPHYRVAFDGEAARDGAVWRLDVRAGGAGVEAAFDRPLWPVAQSAAELLLSPELRGRVGQCADEGGCGWLFLDLSKNRSRRWCSIADCGNRAKQRRLQQRLKAAG
jgi:predicted RNA-binding Zn ribbon-like protein